MKNILLCAILFLVLHFQPAVSQDVLCYTEFSLDSGTCSDPLGEVMLDDCCLNPNYGYQERGACKSCRYAAWTEWSSWSSCTVTCLKGVTQRKRSCYGIGRCQDSLNLGTIQTKPCEDRSCCPENGGWSEWTAWQPCSVTCLRGIKRRNRMCNNPPSKCGGSCLGHSEETAECDTQTVCPTHGGWSSWGSWGPCKGTCQHEGSLPPERQRYRTCTNPPPSSVPRGNDCPDSNRDGEQCLGLPLCPVNGNWGAWSGLSQCSVTCGVGRQTQQRKCDNPAPKHGGRACTGDDSKISLCFSEKNCPANGHWSEWSQWTSCESPNDRSITCRTRKGNRRRERDCLGRDHGGKFCPGEGVDFQNCYDIDNCEMKGVWSEWSSWSFCKPDCGENSQQTRKKTCIPDLTKYKEKNLDIFSGTPEIDCPDSDETEEFMPCSNVPAC